MPLLLPDEISVAALMADLPIKRSHTNQIKMQIKALVEGLAVEDNPVTQNSSKRHTVGTGETLPIIAMRVWGSPDGWRAIALANNIQYPFAVYPGQILIIPGG